MTRSIGKKITIGDAAGTAGSYKRYTLAENEDGIPQFHELSDPDQWGADGKPVERTWNMFGGGLGKAVEFEGEEPDGGYYFSKNCYATPYGVKPAPTVTSVAITGCTTPMKWFFEAETAAAGKYALYALADDGAGNAYAYKIRLLEGTPEYERTFTFAPPDYPFATGSYTGNGRDDIEITGLPFQPNGLIIKARTGSTYPVYWTSTMTVGESKLDATDAMLTDGVKSATSDGFVLGTNGAVNTDTVVYDWAAWKDDGTTICVGSYTGDGNATQVISSGVDFEPDSVIVIPDALGAGTPDVSWRTEDMDATESYRMGQLEAAQTDLIRAFSSTPNFTVGNDADVNTNTKTYHFIVFKELGDCCEFHKYTGSTSAQSITLADPFQGEMVLIRHDGADQAIWRPDSIDPSSSMSVGLKNNNQAGSGVTAINSNGFDVSIADTVGGDTDTYYYGVFRGAVTGTPAVGKPFFWDGKWRVPLGDSASFATLDTIADNAADTWSYSPDIKALHFAGVGNEMARAHDTNNISLVSADPNRTGNWGADYPVGEPSETITDIEEYSGELAVTTIKGLHFFDGVGYAQRKLTFGEDSENGQGMFLWYDQMLVPAKGALHVWRRGSSQPVGPDADDRNQVWPNITGEVRHGRHYGLAGIKNTLWIYGVYQFSSTENYICTIKPWLYGPRPFRWDTLLSVDDTSKWLYAETIGPRLWWPENTGSPYTMKFISLKDDGSPEGSTYGQASDTAYFYPPEWVLPGKVRFRSMEIEIPGSATEGNFGWTGKVLVDRGASASLTGTIADRGFSELFWTAGTNDTGFSVRAEIICSMSSYTPSATPPEIRRITIRAMPIPDEAANITAVVDLAKGPRTVEKTYDDLRAHIGTAASTIRHPITNKLIKVNVTQVHTEMMKQKGNLPPAAVAVVKMRRSDTS